MFSRVLFVMLAVVGLAACGPRSAAVNREASMLQSPGEESAPAKAGNEAIARELQRAAEGEWDRLRLVCECRSDAEWRSVELFGSGVGIWYQKRQFELPRAQMTEIMRTLQDADFAAMPPVFGGSEDPKIPKFAQRVICRLGLELNGVLKESAQLDKGRQSPELKALAEKIFQITESLGREGLTASSLNDGLHKVAAGELAPEVLRVVVNRKPDHQAVAQGEAGWLLRIQSGQISVSPYRGPEGYGEELIQTLSAQELRSLAKVLADQKMGDLPVNLFAEHYTDLAVEALSWEKRLQARRFAGMTRETHGAKQRQFEAVFGELERLVEKVGNYSPGGH